MIIKEIIIVDVVKKEANIFAFNDLANIIFSDNNTVGKSSLLKSIYYTLGIDKVNFANGWDINNFICKIYYKHNGNSGYIIRYKNNFWVNNNDKILNLREYSNWFMQLFNINIKGARKKDDELEQIYIAGLLSLFCIDQDISWDGYLYKKIANLEHYKSDTIPKRIFEYLFDIHGDNINKLEEKEIQLKKNKEILYNKKNVLCELKEKFVFNEEIASNFDEEKVKKK